MFARIKRYYGSVPILTWFKRQYVFHKYGALFSGFWLFWCLYFNVSARACVPWACWFGLNTAGLLLTPLLIELQAQVMECKEHLFGEK